MKALKDMASRFSKVKPNQVKNEFLMITAKSQQDIRCYQLKGFRDSSIYCKLVFP